MESLEQILSRIGRSTSGDTWRPSGPEETAETEEECPVCDGARWLRTGAPLGSPDFGKLTPCECQQRAWGERRADRLTRYSNLGPLTRLTFEATRRDGREGFAEPVSFRVACEAADAYAENPSGWLVLLGPSGCGKTHLAAAVANKCVEQGKPVLFVSVPELLDHLRAVAEPGGWPAYEELFEEVSRAPLLVLDDLGTQILTRWSEDKLDQIITHRYNARLPTVITSSVDPPSMDERLRTRLLDPALSIVCHIAPGRSGNQTGVGDIPPRMLQTMTFDAFDPRGSQSASELERERLQDAMRRAQAFAEEPDRWLYLAGPTGTGKTHLAVAIANVRLERQEPVTFAFVPDLLDHMRQTFSPDSRVSYDRLFEQIKNCELLILDDLGAHTSTPWAEEKLYQLIVHRYNAALPTVIT
ncbi:MAG: ATP-binding protein, partial [Chloroflexota bacterium]